MDRFQVIDVVPDRSTTAVFEPVHKPAEATEPFQHTWQTRWDAVVSGPLVTALILAGQIVVMLIAIGKLIGGA